MAKIAIAIDFSSCGERALKAGIQLALDLGSDVLLVHAFPPSMKAPVAAGLGYQEVFQEFASQHETDEAVELTTKWANKVREADLEVEIVAEAEEPGALILKAAEDEEVSMIVVGTHGKSGFKRFVLGSVAEEIVRKSKKPVLVVPGS